MVTGRSPHSSETLVDGASSCNKPLSDLMICAFSNEYEPLCTDCPVRDLKPGFSGIGYTDEDIYSERQTLVEPK